MSVEGDLAYDLGLTGGPLPLGGLPRRSILTINGGSSSLKFAVFAAAGPIERVLSGRVERVGLGESRLILSDGAGRRYEDCAVEAPDQAAAAALVIERVARDPGLAASRPSGTASSMAGTICQPGFVTAELFDQSAADPLDPEHLPGESRSRPP
jgi:acetate kinase